MKGNNQGLIYLNKIYNMQWFKSQMEVMVIEVTNHLQNTCLIKDCYLKYIKNLKTQQIK